MTRARVQLHLALHPTLMIWKLVLTWWPKWRKKFTGEKTAKCVLPEVYIHICDLFRRNVESGAKRKKKAFIEERAVNKIHMTSFRKSSGISWGWHCKGNWVERRRGTELDRSTLILPRKASESNRVSNPSESGVKQLCRRCKSLLWVAETDLEKEPAPNVIHLCRKKIVPPRFSLFFFSEKRNFFSWFVGFRQKSELGASNTFRPFHALLENISKHKWMV